VYPTEKRAITNATIALLEHINTNLTFTKYKESIHSISNFSIRISNTNEEKICYP
jgi:hypothetical protein